MTHTVFVIYRIIFSNADLEMNSEFDRPITYQLYGGDWENRLKQEILLGIGGVLLLKKLGIKKDVYLQSIIRTSRYLRGSLRL